MNRQTFYSKKCLALGLTLMLAFFGQVQARSMFMEGTVVKYASYLLSLLDDVQTSAEMVILTGDDCCDGNKAKAITLMYNGEGCSESNTSQPLGTKWECNQPGSGFSCATSLGPS